MSLLRLLLPLFLLSPLVPAQAASFDCSKAATPFEHAICDVPDLSAADERLAKTFATAIGGLTEQASGLMRADQRQWLGYAQRACTDDAKPLSTGRYDSDGASCLVEKFNNRSRILEESRMISGDRFLVQSAYEALPDPYEADNPDSYWKVASHELVYPQLDTDNAKSGPFNAWIRQRADALSATTGQAEGQTGPDASSDTDVRIAVKEVAGANRITLSVSTYWYGHGAAHGNYSISYLHYLTQQARALEASDVFAGKTWSRRLVDLAWAQLQTEHDEWLQVDSSDDIAEIVINPERWDLSDDRVLTIQFQPYEVSAYAYGAPTISIGWDKLEDIAAESLDQVRYGW